MTSVFLRQVKHVRYCLCKTLSLFFQSTVKVWTIWILKYIPIATFFDIHHNCHTQTTSRPSPPALIPLSVLKLRKSFGSVGELLTLVVNGASVFALWGLRLSSTFFTMSTTRLQSICTSLSLKVAAVVAGSAEGALSLQWPVSAHISNSSPIMTCLRTALIAPIGQEKEVNSFLSASGRSWLLQRSRINIRANSF